MTVLGDRFLATFDPEQKQSFSVGGIRMFMIPNRWEYAPDGKVNNPVIANVELAGTKTGLRVGDTLIMSHNCLFDECYQVYGLNSFKYDRWVLAKVNKAGELIPTEQHVIAERIIQEDVVDEYILPESAQKAKANIVRVISDGADFKRGELLGILKWADYEVVYNWNDEERRRIVVWKKDILCKINSMEDKIEPIGDLVAIRPDEAPETDGGFIIPDVAQKKPKAGIVVAVGPGKYATDTGILIPMQVKVGNIVLYSKFAGTTIPVNGEDVLLLKQDECLVIIKK